jgi:hypothetical protein
MNIRVQYNDAKRLLILYSGDQLLALYRNIDWTTAHTIYQGVTDAEALKKCNPEKSLVDFMNELNEPPNEF